MKTVLPRFFWMIASIVLFANCGRYSNENSGGSSTGVPGGAIKTNSIYFMSNGYDSDFDEDDLMNTMGICPYDSTTGLISSNCNIPPALNLPSIPSSYTTPTGQTYMYIPNTGGNSILICPVNTQGGVGSCRDSHVPLAVLPESISIYTIGNSVAPARTTYAYISNTYTAKLTVCSVSQTDGSLLNCKDSGYSDPLPSPAAFPNPGAFMQIAGYYAVNTNKDYLLLTDQIFGGVTSCPIDYATGKISYYSCFNTSTSGFVLTGAVLGNNNKLYLSSLGGAALFTCSLNSSALTAAGLILSCAGPVYAQLSNPSGLFLDSTKSILYVSNTTSVQNKSLSIFSLANSGDIAGPYYYVPLPMLNTTTTVGGIAVGGSQLSPISGTTTVTTMTYQVGTNNNVYSLPLVSHISTPSYAITTTPGTAITLNIPQAGSVFFGGTPSNLIFPTSFSIYDGNSIYFSYGLEGSISSSTPSSISATHFSVSPLSVTGDSAAQPGSYGIVPANPVILDSNPTGSGAISGQVMDSSSSLVRTYLVGNTGNGSSTPFQPFAQVCNLLPVGCGTRLSIPGFTAGTYATDVTFSNGYVYFVVDQYNTVNGGAVIKCLASSLTTGTPNCNTLSIPSGGLYNPQSMVVFNNYAYITNLGQLAFPPNLVFPYPANILFPYSSSSTVPFLTVCKLNSSGDVGSSSDCQVITNSTTSASGPLFSNSTDPSGLFSPNALAIAPSTNSSADAYLLISNMADGEADGYVLSCPIPKNPIPINTPSGLLPLNKCADSGAPLTLGISASKIRYY